MPRAPASSAKAFSEKLSPTISAMRSRVRASSHRRQMVGLRSSPVSSKRTAGKAMAMRRTTSVMAADSAPVAFQELQPGRHGVEEVAHLDHRAGGERGGARALLPPAMDEDLVRSGCPARPPSARTARHRSDRGQGLAPEAERLDACKPALHLGGAVAAHGQRQLGFGMPQPVVGDADEAFPRPPSRSRCAGPRRRARVLDELPSPRSPAAPPPPRRRRSGRSGSRKAGGSP